MKIHIIKYLKKFRDSENGISLISLALVFIFVFLPLLIGVVEISDGFTLKRRVKAAAYSISGIIAKTSDVTQTDVSDMYHVVRSLLEPYFSNATVVPTIVLRRVTRDNNNALSQDFSCNITSSGANCTAGGDASDINITFFTTAETGQVSDNPISNPCFIVGFVQYRYTSIFGVYSQNTPLNHTAIVPGRTCADTDGLVSNNDSDGGDGNNGNSGGDEGNDDD